MFNFLKKNVDKETQVPEEKKQILQIDSKSYLRLVCAVHKELLDLLDYEKMNVHRNDDEKIKNYLILQIKKIIKDKNIGSEVEDHDEFIQSVLDEILGFGPTEKLLRDPFVTDIFINGHDEIFVESKGKVHKSTIGFVDNDHIFRLVQRVASKAGKHLDLGTPYLDSHLPDGSRLHAIIPPIAVTGIKVSIRKFSFNKLWVDTLVEGGSLTQEMAELLKIAVKSRFNIVICGGTGSGKTTLLNALTGSIWEGERVITIEDTPELEPPFEHVVRLVTRSPNSEGKGGVNQSDLMINALRMRPDRVILGELRGPEAFNLLHAMNTGQDGSMVTLHASGAEEVVPRLLNMILMARYSLSAESVRQQIAAALDLVIYVSRLVDGSRRVMSISQVSCGPNGELIVDDLFRYNIEKISPEKVTGTHQQLHPKPASGFMNKLITSGSKDDFYALFPPEKEEIKEKVNS